MMVYENSYVGCGMSHRITSELIQAFRDSLLKVTDIWKQISDAVKDCIKNIIDNNELIAFFKDIWNNLGAHKHRHMDRLREISSRIEYIRFDKYKTYSTSKYIDSIQMFKQPKLC